MNPTLLVSTWRERFSHPIVLLLMVLLTAQSAMMVAFADEFRLVPDMTPSMLVASVGLIGRDVSSGVLPLLLTRPLKRWQYVLTKWLAGSIASCVLAFLGIAAQVVVILLRHKSVPAATVAEAVFEQTTLAFGLTAVLIFFSSCVVGIGDLALWVVLLIVASLIHKFVHQRIGQEMEAFLMPKIDWWETFASSPISSFALVSYVSTIIVCLALAIIFVNRKELSYATA